MRQRDHRVPATVSRRDFLRTSAAGGLGLCALPSAGLLRPADPPAQAVIQIYLAGGLSHIDTFDPKPSAPVEYRGEFKTVKSKLDGEPLSEVLSRTARIADRLTIIRSMTHAEAAHERGRHNMVTGYRPSPVITYPSLGAVVAHELGGRNDLPPYVCVPSAGLYLGTGYLSAAFAPFEIGSEPNAGSFRVRDLTSPKGVDAERQARRRKLLAEVDQGFAGRGKADAIDASAAFYRQAYALIGSKTGIDAFDINAEPKKVRDTYGRTTLGQRLLLARRLVRAGVRYVYVSHGGYDNHERIFPALRSRMSEFDRAYAALIADLDESGMLDSTLVTVTTEFGRTPKVNRTAGRDHWPRVFSVALAGGGVKRGYIHGASTSTGSEPAENPVQVPDLAGTVLHQMGINPANELMSPGNRPIEIVRDARIMREILA